jgi:hypothetical protein
MTGENVETTVGDKGKQVPVVTKHSPNDTNKGIVISNGSESWSSDESVEYRRVLQPKKRSLKLPDPPKSLPTTPKRKETNPFKLMTSGKENREGNSPSPTIIKQEEQTVKLPKSPIGRVAELAIKDIKQKAKDELKVEPTNVDLSGYVLSPVTIPESRVVTGRTSPYFSVELLQFTSPSQFMFQYDKAKLLNLQEEMG